jgi:hypothetical protein
VQDRQRLCSDRQGYQTPGLGLILKRIMQKSASISSEGDIQTTHRGGSRIASPPDMFLDRQKSFASARLTDERHQQDVGSALERNAGVATKRRAKSPGTLG